MQFDRAKLNTVILYTCLRCEPSQLGQVKLHKVLYYSDMLRYAFVGSAFVGATYRKHTFGPTCDQLLASLWELKNDGSLLVRDVDYFGYQKKEFTALKAPELDRLGEDERSLLDDVIDFVCRENTARTISEFSHSLPWELAEFGDTLSYPSSLLLFPTQVSQEAFDLAAGEANEVEAARSKEDPMDYPDFADFRGRLQTASGR